MNLSLSIIKSLLTILLMFYYLNININQLINFIFNYYKSFILIEVYIYIFNIFVQIKI